MSVGRYLDLSRRFLMAHLFKRKYPISVSFIITHRCNYRCEYCNSYNVKENEMTTEQIKTMINEFKEIGIQRLGLTGGEPLLRKDIGEIIDYAKRKNITVTLVSNGLLVPKMIEQIKNVDLLLLSLDGPEKIHNKYRNQGAYKAVIKAVKIAKKNRIRIWTSTNITDETVNHLDFIIHLAKKMDFKCLFQPLFNYPLAASEEKIDTLTAPDEEYKKAINYLIEQKRKGAPIISSKSYFRFLLENRTRNKMLPCRAGNLFCAVSPGGNVAPCHFLINAKKWPSGLKMGFKKAFYDIKQFSCRGCLCCSYMEENLFHLFNLDSMFNAIKNYRL